MTLGHEHIFNYFYDLKNFFMALMNLCGQTSGKNSWWKCFLPPVIVTVLSVFSLGVGLFISYFLLFAACCGSCLLNGALHRWWVGFSGLAGTRGPCQKCLTALKIGLKKYIPFYDRLRYLVWNFCGFFWSSTGNIFLIERGYFYATLKF